MRTETPYERYWRRRQTEIPLLQKALDNKNKEIEKELEYAQAICRPHIDDGMMFEGCCTKCGKLLG